MMPATKPPLEFCATRFLDLWLREEAEIFRGMNDLGPVTEPAKLRKMLKHYSIQRNFRGLADDAAAIKVAHMLCEVVASNLPPVASVEQLAARFKKEEEFRQRNLSAASKLLWMRCRHPYVIFDKQAVNALKDVLGHSFDKSSYGGFYAAWNEEYSKYAGAIESAALGLVALPRKYTAAFELDDAELTELVAQAWFQARVFDLYLWEIGKS